MKLEDMVHEIGRRRNSRNTLCLAATAWPDLKVYCCSTDCGSAPIHSALHAQEWAHTQEQLVLLAALHPKQLYIRALSCKHLYNMTKTTHHNWTMCFKPATVSNIRQPLSSMGARSAQTCGGTACHSWDVRPPPLCYCNHKLDCLNTPNCQEPQDTQKEHIQTRAKAICVLGQGCGTE